MPASSWAQPGAHTVAKMKKRRIKKGLPKLPAIQYWVNEESGRVGISRGGQAAKEKIAAGFTEYGPKRFKRYVIERQNGPHVPTGPDV